MEDPQPSSSASHRCTMESSGVPHPRLTRFFRLRILPLLAAPLIVVAGLRGTPATGPLRPLESNPRWFADGSGKAVLLVGSHTWQNLQDNGLLMKGATADPPPVFDYAGYLDSLARWHHNFFRLWRWETARWTDKGTGNEPKYCTPHPWLRTGPGTANDGKPRFDLAQFNPEYFARLRERAVQAGSRGFYVAIMLFNGWEHQFTDGWLCHPFHAPNNINAMEADTNGDGKATEFNTLLDTEEGRRVWEFQRNYVRQVIDTVNDLDNVLYEVANEAGPYSTAWQYAVIEFIKKYENTLAKQHPVGMTFQYRGGTNAVLEASPADWISPNQGEGARGYWQSPCSDCSKKVVVADTDHMGGHTVGDNIWVWKSFTRGLNPILMEDMSPSPTWQDSARVAMGQVRRFSERMTLAAATPQEKLTNTRYCLGVAGREYLVFQHDRGEFTVDLSGAEGKFTAEWYDINGDRPVPAAPVVGGGVRTFTTPFPGPAALYLQLSPTPLP